MLLNLNKWLKENRYQVCFFVFLVTIAYLNSLNAPFISDDIYSIAKNPDIRHFDSVFRNPFSFIQPLLYYISYKIAGTAPIAFRAINLIFHLGTVFILYALLTQTWNKKIAFISASLFAVHPILTESITWISGGHYVLYGFFFLLSFLLYLNSYKNTRLYLLSLVLFILSLESSALAISLPFVLLLYVLIQPRPSRNFFSIIPFFLLGGCFLLLFKSSAVYRLDFLNSFHYAQQNIYNFNPFLIIPVALTTYLQEILWPQQLSFYHTEIFSYQEVAIRTLTVLFFIPGLIFSYKKNKLIFFWLGFFLLSLLLVLSPIQVASASIAERYVYLASIGIIVPVAYLLYLVSSKNNQLFLWIFIIVLSLLTIRTILRNINWQTYDNFWLSTLQTSPNSYQAHNQVGNVYFKKGNFIEAADEYKKSITIIPDRAETHFNLASALYASNNLSESLDEYQRALKFNPKLVVIYQNMSEIYFRQNNFVKSEELTKKALQLSPNNIDLFLNLGFIYLKEGRKFESQKIFRQVLANDPNKKQAKLGLAESLR